MELTNEHIEILKHTQKVGLFCGDSKEIDELCEFKMMEYAGKKSFVPDAYYRITSDGISTLEDLKEIDPLSA